MGTMMMNNGSHGMLPFLVHVIMTFVTSLHYFSRDLGVLMLLLLLQMVLSCRFLFCYDWIAFIMLAFVVIIIITCRVLDSR